MDGLLAARPIAFLVVFNHRAIHRASVRIFAL
jgi:hypothetical protein